MSAHPASVVAPALLASVAAGIRSGKIRRIAVLTGAGTAVASGIPDFRSPGGMYATLRPELLTATPAQRAAMLEDPTDVVSWHLFRVNPLPYLEVRRPFILGTAARQWQPTLAHAFFALLDRKGLLARVYTQNIDGLDRQCPLDPKRVVNVHGSLDRAECELCGAAADMDAFCAAVRGQVRDIYGGSAGGPPASSPILCAACGRAGVKPATVLYGRSLPAAFFEAAAEDFPVGDEGGAAAAGGIDLLLIAGTSLTVGPANTIPLRVRPGTPRLLFNDTRIDSQLGHLLCDSGGSGGTDGWVQGPCDAGFLAFAEALGWAEELREFVASGECPCCPASRAALGLPVPA